VPIVAMKAMATCVRSTHEERQISSSVESLPYAEMQVGGGILVDEGYLHGAALGCGSKCLRFNGILRVHHSSHGPRSRSGARAIKADVPPLFSPPPLPPGFAHCVIAYSAEGFDRPHGPSHYFVGSAGGGGGGRAEQEQSRQMRSPFSFFIHCLNT
jgi:hypothetical protein